MVIRRGGWPDKDEAFQGVDVFVAQLPVTKRELHQEHFY